MPPGPQLVAFMPSSHLGASHAFYSGVLSPYTVMGWRVPDVRAAMRDLAERGVAFKRYEGFKQDEDGIWVAPSGAQVCWFEDPDGNIMSLHEPPSAPVS